MTKIHPPHIVLDVLVELSAADITDLQLLEALKKLLIEEPAVQSNHNGHIRPVVLADPVDRMQHHLVRRIRMVGMLVTGSENSIHQKAPPAQLKG